MGTGAIVAVVLISICAIAVMVVIIKQASSKDKHGGTGTSYGYYPPPPDAYPPAPVQNQAEYVNQGPPQINIYMKRPAGSMWRCPKCDGENECYAAQCQICGQLLR